MNAQGFEFQGTVQELVDYVSSVFRDGTKLRVRATVELPALPEPAVPQWFRQLRPKLAEYHCSVRPDDFAEVWAALADGRKIGAIKALRELTGWNLSDSKGVVEQIFLPYLTRSAEQRKADSSDPFSLDGGAPRELRCRYESCPENHPLASSTDQVTCPRCRQHMGLPSLVGES